MTFKASGKTIIAAIAAVGSSFGGGMAHAQSLPDLRGKSFTFASFGGDLQKNEDAAWLKPFAAATGVKLYQTDAPELAALETMEQAKNVSIDVVEVDSPTVDQGCGSVFEVVNIDRSQLDPALDKNKCGIPVVKFSFVLAYNLAKFKIPPTSVADFFDTKDFPGVRGAVLAGGNDGLIETALLADGVLPSKMYPIDLDRAIRKIKSISSSIEMEDSFAVLQDGLANGEFNLALLPNGRAFNAAKINPNIKVVFNGAVTLYDNLAIPTGAKNVEAATAFLQYTALNSTQAALAERFPYGVGTVGAAPVLSDQIKAFFPDTFSKELLVQDSKWWANNEQVVNDRLTTVFAQ